MALHFLPLRLLFFGQQSRTLCFASLTQFLDGLVGILVRKRRFSKDPRTACLCSSRIVSIFFRWSSLRWSRSATFGLAKARKPCCCQVICRSRRACPSVRISLVALRFSTNKPWNFFCLGLRKLAELLEFASQPFAGVFYLFDLLLAEFQILLNRLLGQEQKRRRSHAGKTAAKSWLASLPRRSAETSNATMARYAYVFRILDILSNKELE